jgi:hypothetical protein
VTGDGAATESASEELRARIAMLERALAEERARANEERARANEERARADAATAERDRLSSAKKMERLPCVPDRVF